MPLMTIAGIQMIGLFEEKAMMSKMIHIPVLL